MVHQLEKILQEKKRPSVKDLWTKSELSNSTLELHEGSKMVIVESFEDMKGRSPSKRKDQEEKAKVVK